MENKRQITLMWRWSLVSSGAIAMFWTIWYLLAGSVPTVSQFTITKNWVIQFPFEISRWWDVLIGPISSVLIIDIFANTRHKDEESYMCQEVINNLNREKNDRIKLILFLGLIIGLIVGLTTGLFAILSNKLNGGLIVGLATGMIIGPSALVLSPGVSAWIITGLIAGLAIGPFAILSVGLGAGIILIANLTTMMVKKSSTWQSIKDWLATRN